LVLAIGTVGLFACGSGSCRSDATTAAVDAAPEAAPAANASASDGGDEKTLTTFASKDDLSAFFQKLVRDDEDAKNRKTLAANARRAAIEAGVDAGPPDDDGNMWGDSIGDSFGAGGLGLSGIGAGGGGKGEGLGSIGSIGHGAGTGTGSGFGAGRATTARTPDKATSITNTQVTGVDEGDIVKVHGDHLVILRRGRLFTVKVGGDALAPRSSAMAFAPGIDPRGTWYDEMLVSKNTIVVIGYSYKRGATELGLFDIDDAGAIKHRATYQLRANDYYSSRNYASRLLGDKLVFYSPVSVNARSGDPSGHFPALRKWTGSTDAAFMPVLEPTHVYRPLVPDIDMTLHSVTVCSLAEPELRCTARAVLGPSGRVFYVSEDSVYVWTTPYTRSRHKKRTSDGGMPSSDAGVENVEPRSYVYRLPLDGGEPAVMRASGAPIDQFSFHQNDGHLNVLVRSGGNGDAMWAAEGTTNGVALLRVPLSSFSHVANAAPASAYATLPGAGGYAFQNRFVGDWVLYGTGDGWGGTRDVADRKVTAYRYASQNGRSAQQLPLDHVIDRVEPMGTDALVVGGKGADLVFSAIALGGPTAEARGRYVRKNASQGETRSHGFFYKPDNDTSGVFGLPLRSGEDVAANQLVAGSASIVFVKNDALAFKELGAVAARAGGSANDGCLASCVDWYGNARPIFLGDRIVALMGYEVVEAQIEDGHLRERRRVSFAPPAQSAKP
jgi:hypothetical protein